MFKFFVATTERPLSARVCLRVVYCGRNSWKPDNGSLEMPKHVLERWLGHCWFNWLRCKRSRVDFVLSSKDFTNAIKIIACKLIMITKTSLALPRCIISLNRLKYIQFEAYSHGCCQFSSNHKSTNQSRCIQWILVIDYPLVQKLV